MGWKKDDQAVRRQAMKAQIKAIDKLPKAGRTAQKVSRATPITRKQSWWKN